VLVYRSASERIDGAAKLDDLEERAVRPAEATAADHDALRSLLIETGRLESALLDGEYADEDDLSPLAEALNALMLRLADNVVRSWRAQGTELRGIRRCFDAVRALAPADPVSASVPEGFAYYGLFPESYIGPAVMMAKQCAPAHVIVLGIRSIGTTLSAVVAATLAEQGMPVTRFTLRPRGHPFDRELRLGTRLTNTLAALAHDPATQFAIVDEGPGISGSSFACVAELLTRHRVPNERIAFMPSWRAPAEALSNERARAYWRRHPKFVGDFDDDWIASSRLARRFGVRIVADVSAGAWRRRAFDAECNYPAVQTQHERRKYLAVHDSDEQLLIKFEGLGDLGDAHRLRASRLADAGFAPAVTDFGAGFLATRWVSGTPMRPRDATPAFLHHLARYLAWTYCRERVAETTATRRLLEMVEVNVREGLGHQWLSAVRLFRTRMDSAERAPAVRVDARMMPHEWLRTTNGYVKTDAVSHYDDHFYPGATDIAWDIAGALVEFELSAPARHLLLREYIARTGDRGIHRRLPLYRAAYLAFRLGYTTMAAEALGSAPDGMRMRAAVRRSGEALRRELSPWLASAAEHVAYGQSYATDT
jgi:hypothetical protein